MLKYFCVWISLFNLGCLLFRISELHTKKETWKIAVCITDMWDVKKHNGRQAIDMVLMDQTVIVMLFGFIVFRNLNCI